jgi:hypothetical protein
VWAKKSMASASKGLSLSWRGLSVAEDGMHSAPSSFVATSSAATAFFTSAMGRKLFAFPRAALDAPLVTSLASAWHFPTNARSSPSLPRVLPWLFFLLGLCVMSAFPVP